MAAPAPLKSLLGGIALPLPVHALMRLNGSPFGISGFIHRAVRGSFEAFTAVSGLILGGALVGLIEGSGPQSPSFSLSHVLVSGLLVGFGTKVRDLSCTHHPFHLIHPLSYPTAALQGGHYLYHNN